MMNEADMVENARRLFEEQIAFQQAVNAVARLNPAERAAARAKKTKQKKKLSIQSKIDKAKTIEVRNMIRKQFPQASRNQVKHMADEFVAASKSV